MQALEYDHNPRSRTQIKVAVSKSDRPVRCSFLYRALQNRNQPTCVNCSSRAPTRTPNEHSVAALEVGCAKPSSRRWNDLTQATHWNLHILDTAFLKLQCHICTKALITGCSRAQRFCLEHPLNCDWGMWGKKHPLMTFRSESVAAPVKIVLRDMAMPGIERWEMLPRRGSMSTHELVDGLPQS